MNKRKIFTILLLCLLTANIFAQENKETKKPLTVDLDFKIYLPTLFGLVTGDNTFLGLREDYKAADKCSNFMDDVRGTIASVDKFTFSWSFGMGCYVENNKDAVNYSSLNLSLGAGLYYHLQEENALPLSGLCLYLYPMYQIPIFKKNTDTSYLSWKSAVDVGYNLVVLDALTIYPFIRNIFGWNSHDFRYGLDCGIAVGFYFKD